MGKKKTQDSEIPMWAKTGHARPVTRRDFLGAGLIPFSASMILPNWMSLLMPSSAQAAVCTDSAGSLIPFVTLNLAGGAGLAGNFVPHDQGGQMLPSYNLVGLGRTPTLVREFGNVPFAGNPAGNVAGNEISRFLAGVRQTAPNAIAKTAFVGVCVESRDDSSENKFSADGLVAKAGLMGSLLPNLGRRPGTTTGIGQLASVVNPPSPLIVNGLNSLTSSLGYAGSIGTVLKQSQKEALANVISRLSESQNRKLASMQSGSDIKNLLDCAGIKNEGLLAQGTNAVDPRLDAAAGTQISTIWNINSGTGNGDQNLIFSSMVYNAIKGQCGSVSLELGGFDYHDNSATTGDGKDLEAGQNVGRILETANALNRPVFLYITTDGATVSVQSDNSSTRSAWASDRGTAGMAYILYFNPAGRPNTNGFQIGHFTNGQVAAGTTAVASSPEAAAAAVFANYLRVNNRLDLYDAIAGRALESRFLDQVLKFV